MRTLFALHNSRSSVRCKLAQSGHADPYRINHVYLQTIWASIFLAARNCTLGHRGTGHTILIGENSFSFTARYGTPNGYQHQGCSLQLNYGGEATGC